MDFSNPILLNLWALLQKQQNSNLNQLIPNSISTPLQAPVRNIPSTSSSTTPSLKTFEQTSNSIKNEPAQTPESTTNATTTSHGDVEERPKRRTRLGGGPSQKTAEVWKFFKQIIGEQAATCSICNKVIKATNSSTTGMIRHLRSCHELEYLDLQDAREFNCVSKILKDASNEVIRERVFLRIYPDTKKSDCLAQSKHNIDNILSNKDAANYEEEEQHLYEKCAEALAKARAISRHSAFSPKVPSIKKELKRISTSPSSPEQDENNPNGRELKLIKLEPKLEELLQSANVQQQQQIPQPQNQAIFTTPKLKKYRKNKTPMEGWKEQEIVVPENAQTWSEDSEQANELNEQIANLLLTDHLESSFVDQKGFRTFVKMAFPKYNMPTAKVFAQKILPDLIGKWRELYDIQRNNPFGIIAPSPIATTNISECHDRFGVSPSSTVESGFHDDSDNHHTSTSSSNLVLDLSATNTQKHEEESKDELDALVQRSVTQAQNISQSFGYSLDLSGEEISKDVDDSETASSKSSSSEFGRH